jgi:hypothetical protein
MFYFAGWVKLNVVIFSTEAHRALGCWLLRPRRSAVFKALSAQICDRHLRLTILYHVYIEHTSFRRILQIATWVQMFVLGPRLILSIRDYNAKLVGNIWCRNWIEYHCFPGAHGHINW